MKHAVITVLEGPMKGKSFPITDRDMTIGRGSDCQIRAEGYPQVGREHARIRWEGTNFVIQDLASRNKVRVNNVVVDSKKLSSGDSIKLGDFVFDLKIPSGGPEFVGGNAAPAAKPAQPNRQPTTFAWTPATKLAASIAACLIVVILFTRGKSSDAINPPPPPPPSYSAVINEVLQKDGPSPAGSETVDERVQRLKAIKIDGCPTDFHQAFQTYIHAWEALADVQRDMEELRQQQKANETADTIDAISRWIRLDFTSKAQELDAPRQKLYNQGKEAYRKIKETHDEVERLAIQYGASVNPGWSR